MRWDGLGSDTDAGWLAISSTIQRTLSNVSVKLWLGIIKARIVIQPFRAPTFLCPLGGGWKPYSLSGLKLGLFQNLQCRCAGTESRLLFIKRTIFFFPICDIDEVWLLSLLHKAMYGPDYGANFNPAGGNEIFLQLHGELQPRRFDSPNWSI